MAKELTEYEEEAVPQGDRAVGFWLDEIQRATRRNRDWVNRGSDVVDIYRGIGSGDEEALLPLESFNILYSNTETLKPAMFSHLPVPEVERRYLEADPIGSTMAMVMERTLDYCMQIEGREFYSAMEKVRDDVLLPGRGVARVYYEATFEDEETENTVMGEDGEPMIEVETTERKASEEAWVGYVPWRKYLHSDAEQWEDVWWMAFGDDMSREDLVEEFGEAIGRAIPLAGSVYDNDKYYGDDGQFNYDLVGMGKERFARVWEVWDSRQREVVIIAEGYSKEIDRYDDPYNLKNFFPTCEPAYCIKTTASLEPVPEYITYQPQAMELNIITTRIMRLTDALKARGVCDAEIHELTELFDAEDNAIIPSEEYAKLMQAGGIKGAIEWAPIENIAQVLAVLQPRRAELIQEIYELTGISDIMRGMSDPRETATAVKKKGQYGANRIRTKQQLIQTYCRNILRLLGELAAEMFDPETFILMSGVENRDDVLAGMEEVYAKLQDNAMRDYTINIQTDSTIAINEAERMDETQAFFGAIATLMEQMIPAVEQGIVPMAVAKELLLYAARRFECGRELENVLNQIGSSPEEKQPSEQEKSQMAMEKAQQEYLQAQLEIEKMKVEAEREKIQANMAIEQAKLNVKILELQGKAELDEAKMSVQILTEKIKQDTVKINAAGGSN